MSEAENIIKRIAQVAEAFSSQAGVGGMETAGSIVSFLAANPEHIAGFISGETGVFDWPVGWHEHGNLTWHSINGEVVRPEYARRARVVRDLARLSPDTKGDNQ